MDGNLGLDVGPRRDWMWVSGVLSGGELEIRRICAPPTQLSHHDAPHRPGIEFLKRELTCELITDRTAVDRIRLAYIHTYVHTCIHTDIHTYTTQPIF